jgi:hypothetical protein
MLPVITKKCCRQHVANCCLGVRPLLRHTATTNFPVAHLRSRASCCKDVNVFLINSIGLVKTISNHYQKHGEAFGVRKFSLVHLVLGQNPEQIDFFF